MASVHTAVGTQLGEKELHDVVIGTLHALADIRDIGKDRSPVPFTETLRRGDLVGLGTRG